MNIESVIRRTIIIINGEEFIVNESDLTEIVTRTHLKNWLNLKKAVDFWEKVGKIFER